MDRLVKNNKYEIMTPKGWKDFEGINKKDIMVLYKITLDDLTFFTATENHEFYTNGEKIAIKNIKTGQYIDTSNGSKRVVKKDIDREDIVYDIFNVDNKEHNFILSESQAITKNCDEFAFVPGNQAEEFWAANYPTISASKQAKVVVISTPNGMFNIFHRLYSQAERGENTFEPTKVTWKRVPGRDEDWAAEQLKNLGPQKFAQEFDVEFLGSTNTVIDTEVLATLLSSYEDHMSTDLNGRLTIYEKPVDKAIYILGVDPAKGTGEHYSAIQILKLVSSVPVKIEQVAVFRDNLTDVYEFSNIVDRLSYFYNRGYIMCENNGEGSAVIQRLWWELENENLVNTGSKAKNLGIRSTRITKPRAVLLMKKLIEDGSVKLVDRNTVEELASFIEEKNKFFGKDKPDDCVSALYWGLFLLEMNILDEKFQFDDAQDEDVWGILSNTKSDLDEDWSWLNDTSWQS